MFKYIIYLFISFIPFVVMDAVPIGGHWSFGPPMTDLFKGKKVVIITAGTTTNCYSARQNGMKIIESLKEHNIESEWLFVCPPYCADHSNNDTIVKKINEAGAMFIGGGKSEVYQGCLNAHPQGMKRPKNFQSKLIRAVREMVKTKP
jgi:hypothetical protein